MIFPALREHISNLQSQGDASSTSTILYAILENERILTDILNQVQETGIGNFDYANILFKLAVLKMKAATTNCNDDGDTVDSTGSDNDINVSSVTLSTDHRIQLCQEAFEDITSCHELRGLILPSTHERVREANHLMEKAKDWLHHLKRSRSFDFLKGHHAPAA